MSVMIKKILLGAAIVGVSLGGSLASARADVNFDGIDIPLGANFNALNVNEQLVSAVGNTLEGVGIVSNISSTGTSGFTYFYGQGNRYLTFGFSGFVVSAIQAPTATTAGFVDFTGGTVVFAVNSSSPNLNTNNQATDFTNATTGNISSNFLTLNPVSFHSSLSNSDVTLEATIPANATLGNFSQAAGSAFFDAIAGDALNAFHTCSIATSPGGGACPPNTVDFQFQESFSTGSAIDFPVSGTGQLKGSVVPEPMSLALLGFGMLGIGIARRVKR